jgi:prepilin-type processing-associated H-X9-DG protein
MGKEFEPCGADSNALAIVKAMPTFYCPKVTSKDPLANFCSLVPLVWFNAYPGNPGTGDQQTKVSSNPSKYPLAGDGNVGGITKPDLKIDKYAMPMFRHGSTYRTPDSSYQYPSPGDTQLRGDGVANIIFCDGRVESFTRTRWDNAVASQEILLSKP